MPRPKDQLRLNRQNLLREKSLKRDPRNLVPDKSKDTDLKAKIKSTKDKLSRTKILAPTSGVIVGLKNIQWVEL